MSSFTLSRRDFIRASTVLAGAACLPRSLPAALPKTPSEYPPGGWNSYDCFGSAVTEREVLANAEVLARELSGVGYDTVVVDYCWSHPAPGAVANPNQSADALPRLAIDSNHRLVPAASRFPSAQGDAGFRPLAGKIHALGLQFGIHMMRGFPRQAYEANIPTRDGGLRPVDIADPTSTCKWLNHMYGVRRTAAGQAYYDSVFALYAEWGVDFVKVDDMLKPYHADEIEMVDRARRRCGRKMTLSLSPGPCPIEHAEHVRRHADLWRLSADFWDEWKDLRHAFDYCRQWQSHRFEGAWPDPDMLPVGRLAKRGPKGVERDSRLTPAEQRTLLTLWSIFGAPMFIGGNLPDMDRATLDLLKHRRLAELRHNGTAVTCVSLDSRASVWKSEMREGNGVYAAVFNLDASAQAFSVGAPDLGIPGPLTTAEDMWHSAPLHIADGKLNLDLLPHDVALLAIN